MFSECTGEQNWVGGRVNISFLKIHPKVHLKVEITMGTVPIVISTCLCYFWMDFKASDFSL